MAPVQTREVATLFPEKKGLDDRIAEKLEGVVNFSRQRPALVSFQINLNPGMEYVFYLLMQDEKGNDVVRGMRAGSERYLLAAAVALAAIRMTLSAFGIKDPGEVEHVQFHL